MINESESISEGKNSTNFFPFNPLDVDYFLIENLNNILNPPKTEQNPIEISNYKEKQEIKNETKSNKTEIIKEFVAGSNKKNGGKNIGRKRKANKNYQDSNSKNLNDKSHNKFRSDNLRSKINGHFLKFTVDISNVILDFNEFDEKFCKFENNVVKSLKKDYLSKLKNLEIKEILTSPELCNKKKENLNVIIKNKVINNSIVNKFLSQKYIELFRNIYYISKRNINMANFGIDSTIILPKNVKMYKNLKEKKENKDDEEYLKCLENFVIKNYF